MFPHGSLPPPLPVKQICTRKHKTHTPSVQSPLLFLSSSLLIYWFLNWRCTRMHPLPAASPPSPFSHIFSKASAAAGEAPACQRGSGPFRVTHRGLRRIPYLKELCLCRPVRRPVCGGGEAERSLADDGRAGGRRENRGAETRHRQTSAFAWHLHGTSPRKCRNMRRR